MIEIFKYKNLVYGFIRFNSLILLKKNNHMNNKKYIWE